MKKSQLITAFTVLICTIVVTAGTVLLLSYIEKQRNNDTNQQSEQKEKEANVEAIKGFEENIDEDKNEQAQAIESDAMGLIESDPAKAYTRYLEAEKVYKDAGNMNKVGEMRANALTAQAQIEADKAP